MGGGQSSGLLQLLEAYFLIFRMRALCASRAYPAL